MTRLLKTRATGLVLLVAMVHQLGASPCGCWEHNGWRQSVVCVFTDDHPHDHAEEGDACHAADCEPTPPLAALASARSQTPDTPTGVGYATPAPVSPLASNNDLIAAFAIERTLGVPALSVRAQTQVFRL